VSKKKPSGTQSAASSISRPPERLTLYLDESLDSESLAAAFTEAGTQVIRGSKHFPRGTPDEVWLPECGRNGWVVLTRDKRIRYRILERTALHEAGVKAFVFTGGNVSLKDTVQILAGSLNRLESICRAETPPFIYHLGASGKPVRMK
jgi:hypothetical protein